VTGSWKGDADLLAKVDKLRADIGVGAVLLTRSEEGMTLFDDSGVTHEPARAREVFDVTGAGDTVIATLAALLATGMPLPDAMHLANKAGGIVVGKFGTATVSYDELSA
jgi:rfaE bifunctional protein kinase chain/domain